MAPTGLICWDGCGDPIPDSIWRAVPGSTWSSDPEMAEMWGYCPGCTAEYLLRPPYTRAVRVTESPSLYSLPVPVNRQPFWRRLWVRLRRE